MLESIHIENVALIKKIDLSFSPAFSAFTGETGAGKSIIIDSIGCLCGNKVAKELIRNGESFALVEGMFSEIGTFALEACKKNGVEPDEDGVIYISRTVKNDGKSKVAINRKTVPLSVLREISRHLINIHGQHDNTELLKPENHLKILDSYGETDELLKAYNKAFFEYCQTKKLLCETSIDENEKQRQIEMLKFQINDIASLKLSEGEEEKLIEEKKRLLNLEKISKNTNIVSEALEGAGNGVTDSLDRAIEAVRSLERSSDKYDGMAETLSELKSKIADIAETIVDMFDVGVDNPEQMLDRIEMRLDRIQKAKRKYGSEIGDILNYLEKAKKQLDELESSDKKAEALKIKLHENGIKLKECGAALTKKRTSVAEKMTSNIEQQLKYLDMSSVKFKVGIAEKAFGKDGADDVEFLVMTNAGEGFSPLAKTASGGELSRIMLAVKSVIAEKDGIDTLIFDEVDTGISGKTSRKIGLKLNEISKASQVLCVTHSAQICSVADEHFLVSKKEENGRTVTNVCVLGEKERIEETARIISGIDITNSSIDAAKELINSRSLQ